MSLVSVPLVFKVGRKPARGLAVDSGNNISSSVVKIINSINRQENNPYIIYSTVEGSHLVNLQKPWTRIRKQAKLEDVRIHDLRHSFASIGAANGLSLPIIGALLGHTQVQNTARNAHLAKDPLKHAVNLIVAKIIS